MRWLLDTLRDAMSPILSDRTIMKYNAKGHLIEQEIQPQQLQPNSVDLTLGNSWKTILPNAKVYHRHVIDPRTPIKFDEGHFEHGRLRDAAGPQYADIPPVYEERERFILYPYRFVLMASNEILNIPNGIVGIVCGRSSIARLGIQTEQAGFIDAGFRGTITFEVHNQGVYPIILYPGMRVAQVYFLKAQKALKAYGAAKGSKYNEQILATASRIHLDNEFNT